MRMCYINSHLTDFWLRSFSLSKTIKLSSRPTECKCENTLALDDAVCIVSIQSASKFKWSHVGYNDSLHTAMQQLSLHLQLKLTITLPLHVARDIWMQVGMLQRWLVAMCVWFLHCLHYQTASWLHLTPFKHSTATPSTANCHSISCVVNYMFQ